MPTQVYSFLHLTNGDYKPMIPISVINPSNNQSAKFYALLDTGADKCVFPKGICDILGIDLKAGKMEATKGVEGNPLNVWIHTFKIQLLNPTKEHIFWKSKEIEVCCLDHDNAPPLIGWENLMVHFNIRFNYPTKRIIVEV